MRRGQRGVRTVVSLESAIGRFIPVHSLDGAELVLPGGRRSRLGLRATRFPSILSWPC